MLDVAISEDPGEDDRVATLGRWPDVLARPLITFAAGDRGAVFALAVLVRGEPPDDGVFDEGDKLGRTPDSEERDCMNLRNSTPFSLTSSPFPRPLDMSIVVRPTGIVLRLGGSAGTGGGTRPFLGLLPFIRTDSTDARTQVPPYSWKASHLMPPAHKHNR